MEKPKSWHAPLAKDAKPASPIEQRKVGVKLIAEGVAKFASGSSRRIASKPQRKSVSFVEPLSLLLRSVPGVERARLAAILSSDLQKALETEVGTAPAEKVVEKTVGKKQITNEEFLEQFEAQEVEQREQDIAEERLIAGSELCARLHISSQALSAKLKRKKVFALKAHGRYYYPSFFADGAYDQKDLEIVSEKLGNLPAGSKWSFFITKRISLNGKSPLELLAKGKLEQVLNAVQAFLAE